MILPRVSKAGSVMASPRKRGFGILPEKWRLVGSLTLFLVLSASLALVWAGNVQASPGDDSSWELGTWAIRDYSARDPSGSMNLNTALEIASGFRWGMVGAGFAYDVREDQNCKERHLRDPRFSVNGSAGNDQYSFDKNDFGLFVGHGGTNCLCFANQVDSWDLLGQYVRWGNWDLEWAYIFACQFTSDGGNPSYLDNDRKMLAGAHAICGFVDIATLYENGTAQGQTWANLLRGQGLYTYSRPIIDAWNEGNDYWQPSGRRLRTYYGYGCRYDYLPGEGTYSTTDPVPVESGGQPYSLLYTCG